MLAKEFQTAVESVQSWLTTTDAQLTTGSKDPALERRMLKEKASEVPKMMERLKNLQR